MTFGRYFVVVLDVLATVGTVIAFVALVAAGLYYLFRDVTK